MGVRRTPLRLEPEACDGCGRCAAACPDAAMKVGPGYIYVDWERCTGCGTCVERCDRDAIDLRGDASVARSARQAGPTPSPRPVAVGVPQTAPRSGLRPEGVGDGSPPPSAVDGSGAADDTPHWTLPEAALVLVTAFALLIGVQALLGEASSEPVAAGLTLLAYDAALAAPVVWMIRRRHATALAALRLDRAPETRSAALAALLLVATLAFTPAYRMVLDLAGVAPPPAAGPGLGALFGTGPAAVALAVLAVGVLGPVVEEVALRGIVLGALAPRIGEWPATIVSALAFALLHASPYSFVPLLVLGLALGRVSVGRRSLWPAIVLHVGYNAWFVVASLLVAARG